MRKFPLFLGLAIAMTTTAALAQKATEQYIPMGRSPGLSGQYTDIADIVSIDGDQRLLTIRADSGEKQVRVAQETRIWFDRTRYGRPNFTVRFEDLTPGQRVEVYYGDATRQPLVADWIKAVPRSEP